MQQRVAGGARRRHCCYCPPQVSGECVRLPETQGAPIVAVRPFGNLSGDTSQEQFANGISEELRGQISKISSIRLLSRTAVERYAGADSRKLASELGANQIVDGSVRIHAGKLRVSVQLVDASTDQTIWSEQYDRRFEDILRGSEGRGQASCRGDEDQAHA